ncbi:hypothetical protein C8Q73DRAFT_791459 [Cubamyces lactineus]|nr:hypothetical protein C8Q73DRAFT_791459 [Cubamyces lactineus]
MSDQVRNSSILSAPQASEFVYPRCSEQSCSTLTKAQYYAAVVQYILWAVFSAIRALALGRLNWMLASLVFVLACAPFAVNLWTVVGSGTTVSMVPTIGCIGGTNQTAYDARIGTVSVLVDKCRNHE